MRRSQNSEMRSNARETDSQKVPYTQKASHRCQETAKMILNSLPKSEFQLSGSVGVFVFDFTLPMRFFSPFVSKFVEKFWFSSSNEFALDLQSSSGEFAELFVAGIRAELLEVRDWQHR